ncbi:hypothetical protein GE061_007361 [Apolygus lucorum]|uniref:Uncharacterized protein n=1 Tax=Apolygus lucorum TaxID=248454 RepID=A0A6A4J2Z0_APOLU|nr:hypothetical protein GE061_007361 [Apolygus lucorum]
MSIDGREVPVLHPKGDGYELDEKALSHILMDSDVKERYVVVVSVAGDYRKGKSFLLDYFLRYLNFKYPTKEKTENESEAAWMGKDGDPLEGFSWRYGSKRHTKGIWMWSRVFLTTLATKEKIAILLLDTQGSFDTESTMNQSATVFALSTMVSSNQCFNVSKNIQENDINNLQFFTEYGRIALEFEEQHTPFQRLIFLVRDWEYPGEASYGEGGGQTILEERLRYEKSMPTEKRMVRQHIRTCFSDIRCFLMPHPGPAITDPRFNGRLKDLSTDFKLHLSVLVPWILSPENLIIKQISGKKVRAKELTKFFLSYSKVLSGRDLPEPKTLYMATADGNNAVAVAEAKELYNYIMIEEIMEGQRKYVEPLVLRVEHKRVKESVMDHFDAIKKIGGEEYSAEYRKKLDDELEQMFRQIYMANHSRKHWYWRKPALYAGAALSFIALGQILRRMGVSKLTIMCDVAFKIAIFGILSWFYARYRDLDDRSRHP